MNNGANESRYGFAFYSDVSINLDIASTDEFLNFISPYLTSFYYSFNSTPTVELLILDNPYHD